MARRRRERARGGTCLAGSSLAESGEQWARVDRETVSPEAREPG